MGVFNLSGDNQILISATDIVEKCKETNEYLFNGRKLEVKKGF